MALKANESDMSIQAGLPLMRIAFPPTATTITFAHANASLSGIARKTLLPLGEMLGLTGAKG